MQDIQLSLVLPSRNAPNSLYHCVHSTIELADDPTTLEFIILIDEDEKIKYIPCLTKLTKLNSNIKVKIRPQSPLLNTYYYSYGAEIASGNFIIGLTDDKETVTSSWDTLIKLSIKEFTIDKPDNIVYLMYEDNCLYPNGACLLHMSKSVINILGGIMPKEVQRSGGDSLVYSIFQILKDQGYNRILDLGQKYQIKSSTITDDYILTAKTYCEARNMEENYCRGITTSLPHHRQNFYASELQQYIKKVDSLIYG